LGGGDLALALFFVSLHHSVYREASADSRQRAAFFFFSPQLLFQDMAKVLLCWKICVCVSGQGYDKFHSSWTASYRFWSKFVPQNVKRRCGQSEEQGTDFSLF